MGIKDGDRVRTINAPEAFVEWLAPLPDGVSVSGRFRTAPIVMLFATTETELRRGLDRATTIIPPDGAIWVCWPKRASGTVSPLQDREILTSHCFPRGLVDIKVAAISDIWSGLKFVIRKHLR